MRVEAFERLVAEWLRLEDFKAADRALNGLQVASSKTELEKIAFAVDASLESFRRACEWGADLLFVHHGLFWGEALPVTGVHYRRLRELLLRDLALFAAHLPLDAHPELGNNAGIAAQLELQDLEPFGAYHGVKIGLKGRFPRSNTLDEVVERLCGGARSCPGVLPFGPQNIQTAGVVSGGEAEEVMQAIEEGLDLFITGESSHIIYHHCLEARINVIFGGHYLTEVWGVKRLAEKIRSATGLQTAFLDIPTGF